MVQSTVAVLWVMAWHRTYDKSSNEPVITQFSVSPGCSALISPSKKETFKGIYVYSLDSLQWRHSESDGVSNHRYLDCLFNYLFRRKSKNTSELRALRPVTRKLFPFDDVIMFCSCTVTYGYSAMIIYVTDQRYISAAFSSSRFVRNSSVIHMFFFLIIRYSYFFISSNQFQ